MAARKMNIRLYQPKKKTKGKAAKSKTSTHKSSKNYVKPYRGQGR